MPEELFVQYKIKNRKTGELTDIYFRIPDVEAFAGGMKKYFDVHEYRIYEKRLVSKEEFEKRRSTKNEVRGS